MGHDATADNVLHNFRDHTGQADRSVIRTQIFLAFLKCRYDTGSEPLGTLPSFKDF